MRRALPALLALAVAATAPAAAMDGHGAASATRTAEVSIGFDHYTPAQLTVLTGDQVHFANDSVRAHTVTADDGSFDSGRITVGGDYMRTVTTPGPLAYHCTLHAGMRGALDVRSLVLDAPGAPAAAGRPYPLHGRVALPAGTDLVVQADGGSGFADVAHTSAGDDGTFTVLVGPTAGATYRVAGGGQESNTVALLVLDRHVTLSGRRARGRDTLTAQVTPPSPGAHVVLQLRLPDRFGWWPVQRARLDAHSRARFALRVRRRLPARVHLTLADGATVLAESRTVHVGPVRRRR